ncbi:MAG: esterase family protein [Chloroflexi bacterium]|nr:esterase family protein [Chloroflexota bacterium]MCI0580596.1 esterase family protein [Chloroflexota bacterium]MCI0648882.1 esterase family protein [Chloroflexota bacterium]MCI0728212.1 esterase family protein [Chloroflexota bacterium]
MTTLLERAQREGTPLIDGETVTFVWAGVAPPCLLGDFNHWDPERAGPMVEAESGVWTHQETFPRAAYMEYAYILDPDTSETDAGRGRDPYNPRLKWNGLSATNHYFYMPDAQPTPLVRRRRGVPKGTLTHHRVQTGELTTGRRRDVYLYRPSAADPVPLLVVLDGPDYLRQGKIAAIVDNLIAQQRIRPIALALPQNGRQARFLEYACSDATVGFLVYCLLPLAYDELNLLDPAEVPGAYGILGASLGGVMAVYAGYRVPQLFGRVFSQAGAFSLAGNDLVIYDLVTSRPAPPLQVRLDVGTYDFLYQTNQRLCNLLIEKGVNVSYHEYPAGHNFFAWRDQLAAGLEFLFPTSNL